jgi:hypothetical protein
VAPSLQNLNPRGTLLHLHYNAGNLQQPPVEVPTVCDCQQFFCNSKTGMNADVSVPADSDIGFETVVSKIQRKAQSVKDTFDSKRKLPRTNRISLSGVRRISALPIITKRSIKNRFHFSVFLDLSEKYILKNGFWSK